MGGIKVTYNPKIKPLLMLVVCMCIFVSASCIYAADIDDATANNQGAIDINALNGEEAGGMVMSDVDSETDISQVMSDETPNLDTYDMPTDSADLSNIRVPDSSNLTNHSSQSANKTHFSQYGEKSDLEIHEMDNETDDLSGVFGMLCCFMSASETQNHNDDENQMHDSDEIPHDDFPLLGNAIHRKGIAAIKENILFKLSQKPVRGDAKHIGIAKDRVHKLSGNIANSFEKPIISDSKLTNDSEFSCELNHRIHKLNISAGSSKALVGDNADNLTYYYNNPCTQSNAASDIVFRFKGSDENEGGIVNTRNRSFNNIPNFNYNQNANDGIDLIDLTEYKLPSIINSDGDLTGEYPYSFYGDLTQGDYNVLNIDSLYSELNIKDYNLEYYIFTNPDIIIKNANVPILNIYKSPKTNTLTFNKNINYFLKRFDAKTFFSPTFDNSILNRNRGPVFKEELLAASRIIEDNHALFDSAAFFKKAFSLKEREMNALMIMDVNVVGSAGQSSIVLSNLAFNHVMEVE